MKVISALVESDEKDEIVPNCKTDSLLPIIRGKVDTNQIDGKLMID